MSGPVIVPVGTPFGPYRILRELGRGGMGVVYLAEIATTMDAPLDATDPPHDAPDEPAAASGEAVAVAPPLPDAREVSHELSTDDLRLLHAGTRVAIKTFHPHLVQTSDFGRRFRREAKVGAAIRHPNVVRTIDAGTAVLLGTPTNFLAMEYVEGQTLRDLIREQGRVPEALTRDVARQVASGLDAIHRAGITHRDLKPENVILTRDHRVKIMDLGVAKVREESIRLSLTGQFLGTIHYASPEQFRAPETVDHRTDLYALGVLLHEMTAGENPFFHDDLRVVLRRTLSETPRRLTSIHPEVSPVIDQLAASLMAKEPGERPQAAAVVADVLERGEDADWWQRSGRSLWAASAGRVVRRLPVDREAELAGRDADLQALRAHFDAVLAGKRRVVFVEGEAGVGKTRLLDAFTAGLQEGGVPHRFLFGIAPPPGTGRPLHAFGEALLQGIEPRDPAEALAELLPPGSPVAEFAAFLTGGPGGTLPMDRVRPLFAAAFRALAAREPVVLVLDEMHRAGENSARMLGYLAQETLPAPLLVLVGLRPTDDQNPVHPVVHGQRPAQAHLHPVHRLAPKDVGILLRSVLRSERLVQELGFRLLEKTEGNPFFILEVVRSLQQDQVLRRRDSGGWTMAGTRVEIHVPDSVRELLQTALSRISDEDRELLDVAAVLGAEFDPEVLAEVTAQPKLALLKRLSVLERRHRLIRAAGRKCRFDHPQLRDTLYDAIMEGLREEYHAQAGDVLEKRRGAPQPDTADGPVAIEMARHFVLGNRPERAVRWMRPALRAAAQAFRTDDILGIGLRFADAAETAPEGVPPELRAEVLLLVAAALEHEGRHGEQRQALERARGIAAEAGDRALQRRALDRVFSMHFASGDFEAAAGAGREALRLATRSKDRDGALAAIVNTAGAWRAAGRYESAASALRRALRFLLSGQSELRRCVVLTQLALVEHRRGRGRTAQRHFLEAVGLARPFGIADAGDVSASRIPEQDELRDRFTGLSRALGRYAETRADGDRTLLLGAGQPRRLREAAALLSLGLVADHLGQGTDARGILLGSLKATREAKDARLEGAILHALGENALGARAPEVARRWFEDALAVRRRIGYRPGVCETLLALGQVAALGGEVETARPYLEEARELAPALEMPGIAALAHATAALLSAREGRRELARTELEQAQEALSLSGPLSISSRVEGLWFAALAAEALGDHDASRQHLLRAREMLGRIADGMAPDERRAFLFDTSPHREILAALGERPGAA